MRSDGYDRPSEHRRYFRVMEDILDCPKLAATNGDGFRAYLQILAMLNRTKSQDGTLTLNKFSMMAATSKGRADSARKLLQHLADIGLMSVEHRGDVALLTVPKWAENQGFSSPPVPTPIPSPLTVRTGPAVREGEDLQEDQEEGKGVAKPDPYQLPQSVAAELTEWARQPHAWNGGRPLAKNQVAHIKAAFADWKNTNQRNPMSGWVRAFKTIAVRQAEQGKLPAPPGGAPSRYVDASEVLADARRKAAADDDERGAEQIGEIIDLALAAGARD